jgi:hypothetical protein
MKIPIRLGGLAGLAFSAGLLAAAARLSAEDLTIVSKVTFANREGTVTHYVTSERSRTSGADSDSIVSFADGKVTFLDHRQKEYWETTVEEMEEYWDRMARKMRTSGAGDMFDLRGKPKLERLKGQKKIAGYDCYHYSLEIGDALEVDFWAAPALTPPARYYDARRLSAVAMGPMGALLQRMYEELKSVKAYPLSTAVIIRTPFSRMESDEDVTEVRKGPIPASTFDVPAKYKKVKPPFDR